MTHITNGHKTPAAIDIELDISLGNSISEVNNRKIMKQREIAAEKGVSEQSSTINTLLWSIINTFAHLNQNAVSPPMQNITQIPIGTRWGS